MLTQLLILLLLRIASASADPRLVEEPCYCGYRQSGLLLTLRCAADGNNLPRSVFRPVLCHRLGDMVRIGETSGVAAIREEAGLLGMAIEPYGLSELQTGGRVVKLQLNLPLQAKLLDSLAFAGLPDLKTLHAWRAPLALEACSLAGLPQLERLVLSCASTFDRFLTFGPSFKSIRLIGCLGRQLQFVCSQCTQRSDISVLRILPGPPSPGGIVTFESWWNTTHTVGNSVVLGKCRPGVCSDDHLCRHNYPLKLARSYRPRQPMVRITTTVEPKTDAPENGRRFMGIFLPILAAVLIIAIALCMFMSLRISGAIRKKHWLLHQPSPSVLDPSAPADQTATSPPPPTVPQTTVPLNNLAFEAPAAKE